MKKNHGKNQAIETQNRKIYFCLYHFLGADISDYFNYGFTEETWAQYCDRQRRLRSENNLARLNPVHVSFSSFIYIYS
jgi:hypothetical protein